VLLPAVGARGVLSKGAAPAEFFHGAVGAQVLSIFSRRRYDEVVEEASFTRPQP